MRGFFTIILLITCFAAKAQFRHPAIDFDQTGYTVGIHGRYQLSSNAISSNFVWKAYQGKFLDRSLREKASNRLLKTNGLGADLDFGVYARHLPDSAEGLGWYMNIADRTHASASFTKDLFDLAMFGNAMFADKTAQLSALKVNLLTYKQFEVGILKVAKLTSGKLNIGFGLSLLTGNRNLNLGIDQAELYTHPDGEYLDGTIQGDIRTASLGSTQYFDANGLGFSGAISIGYESVKFGIKLDADDLGLIRWNQNLKHTELDSTFRFEGVSIDLLGGDGLANISLDTVIEGLISELQPTSYTTLTPGRIRLEGFYKVNDQEVRVYAGVQYRIASGYVPYGYVGCSSPLPKGFFVDGRFAYGGFGSFHLGLEFRKKFAQVFEVRLGTNNLEGYVLPMVGTSQSAYIGLAGFF